MIRIRSVEQQSYRCSLYCNCRASTAYLSRQQKHQCCIRHNSSSSPCSCSTFPICDREKDKTSSPYRCTGSCTALTTRCLQLIPFPFHPLLRKNRALGLSLQLFVQSGKIWDPPPHLIFILFIADFKHLNCLAVTFLF